MGVRDYLRRRKIGKLEQEKAKRQEALRAVSKISELQNIVRKNSEKAKISEIEQDLDALEKLDELEARIKRLKERRR